ncbi:MAG TPA: cupredoxin domain-containing protein [Dehalococcoidia bacterium]|nr:cupredoxin domain-containing protein [Dehalococcoidia bacterium]
MKSKINTRMLAALGLMALSSVALVACNAAVDSDPTPVTTWAITPASGARATVNAALVRGDATVAVSTATAAAAPTPAVGGAPAGSGGATTTLQVVAQGTVFEQTELSAPAGTVTIAFENKDAGILHNLHVYKGADASGESVGPTKLQAGPTSETLTLRLEPGAYYYQCDAHPTSMKGTLTVS